MYNIMVSNELAQNIIEILYYDGCLAIQRKKDLANAIMAWVRPSTFKKINFVRKRWDDEQDKFILSHSLEESMMKLKRTEKSIKMRLIRLNNKFK